jgi:hypothetical protein
MASSLDSRNGQRGSSRCNLPRTPFAPTKPRPDQKETTDTLFRLSYKMELALLIVLVAVLVVCFLSPLIWEASDNDRLVAISPLGWGGDQAFYLHTVATALNAHTLRIRLPDQGHLYVNLTLASLFIASYLTPVSQQAIIIALRITSMLFAAATVILAFILSRRYFGRAAGWLAVLALLTMSFEFIRMSAIAKPDMAQVFFLLLAMYFCCRFTENGELKHLALAAVGAGFAFASKYAGVLLLPILGVAVTLQAVGANAAPGTSAAGTRRKRLRLSAPVVSGVACLLLAGLVSPQLARQLGSSYGGLGIDGWLRFWGSMRVSMFVLGSGSLLVYAMKPTRRWLLQHEKLLDIWAGLVVIFAAFGLASFLSTPLAFADLIRGISFQSAHMTFGHGFSQQIVGVRWLQALLEPQVLTPSVAILCVPAIGAAVYRILTKGRNELSTPESLLAGWVVLYLAFVCLWIRYYSPHFLLPVIPSMIILSVATLRRILQHLHRVVSPRIAALTVGVLVTIILGGSIYQTAGAFRDYRLRTLPAFQEAIQAGQWLTEHYPPRTSILYDAPAYIPPRFGDAHPTWSGTQAVLEKINPQVVVIVKGVADQFADLGLGEKYLGGQEAFGASHDFYGSFQEGAGSYRLQYEAGTTRVYEKR